MKKEEAIKLLSKTKVYVDGKSKEIQEKLFKLGFKWQALSDTDESERITVKESDKPFLFIDEFLCISHSGSMHHFKNSLSREIKADEILSIEIEQECPFKPFDRVLVRNSTLGKWRAGIFSHLDTDGNIGFPFATTNGNYQYCIPYEGNEDLVGTNKSPKQ